MTSMAEDLAKIPQFKRGQVWCLECGHIQKTNGVKNTFGDGWPKCCGYTMSLDSPEERSQLK